jgi:hypothetical protein
MHRMASAIVVVVTAQCASLPAHAQTEPHGWLSTEALATRYGDFEFKNGYPAGDSAARLLETSGHAQLAARQQWHDRWH